jgi:hypothetical protein
VDKTVVNEGKARSELVVRKGSILRTKHNEWGKPLKVTRYVGEFGDSEAVRRSKSENKVKGVRGELSPI